MTAKIHTILVPHSTPDEEAVEALHLFLHDLRTPVSVAQGYLRLLLEDRLGNKEERQRAITQSMEALGRICDLCAGAGEFANALSPAEAIRCPVAELITALIAEAKAKGLCINVHDSPLIGHVRTLGPARAAAAIVALLVAALRSDPTRLPETSVGVNAADLVVTSGDAATRSQLIASAERDTFNAWRGGNGLLVPLAAKQLRETGARIWTLPGESGAVAIAVPLELEA